MRNEAAVLSFHVMAVCSQDMSVLAIVPTVRRNGGQLALLFLSLTKLTSLAILKDVGSDNFSQCLISSFLFYAFVLSKNVRDGGKGRVREASAHARDIR